MPGNPFNDLIEFIKDKIPEQSSSWVELWKNKLCFTNLEDSPTDIHAENTCGTKIDSQTTNIKEDISEYSSSPSLSNVKGTKRKLESDNVRLKELNIEWKEIKSKRKKK